MHFTFLFLILFSFFFSTNSFSFPQIPITKGHLCTVQDKDFKEYRYSEQIPYCKRNVSRSLRTKIYKKYNVDLRTTGQYTIDHIIPLSMGGSNHPDNLFPQHKSMHTGKIEYETYVYLREGDINQNQAIKAILLKKNNPDRDWKDIKEEVFGYSLTYFY